MFDSPIWDGAWRLRCRRESRVSAGIYSNSGPAAVAGRRPTASMPRRLRSAVSSRSSWLLESSDPRPFSEVFQGTRNALTWNGQ